MSDSGATADRDWLRRNRWWLAALPFVLVLALASAAYRVNDLWYQNGWHREVVAVDQGRFVTTEHTAYSFEDKPKPVWVRMRLGPISTVPTMSNELGEKFPVPPGTVGVKLRLDFEAVKGKPAPYCTAYVLDTEGNRYPVEELDGGSNPCPPPGVSPDEPTAPKKWSRVLVAAVPSSARVSDVWVGVSWPEYVRFHLPQPRRAADLAGSGSEQRALAIR
jgi:hypothetical protein